MPKKLRLQVGAVVILAALVFLGMQGAHNFSQYFVPVSQYKTQFSRFAGQVVRVEGTLRSRSVHYNSSTETLTFMLVSGKYQMPVKYVGPMPTEQFKNASAIVEGQMGSGGVFVAQKLLIKCPDHYTAVKVTSANG